MRTRHQIVKRCSLAFRFCRADILPVGLVITAVMATYICMFPKESSIAGMILIRTMIMAVVFFLSLTFKKNELPYYRNLGLPKKLLLALCSLYDFVPSVIILSVCYVFAIQ